MLSKEGSYLSTRQRATKNKLMPLAPQLTGLNTNHLKTSLLSKHAKMRTDQTF